MNERSVWLFQPFGPLWRYCLLAAPIALVPSILLSLAAAGVGHLAHVDLQRHVPPDVSITTFEFIGLVGFAPVAETLLLAGLINLLSSTRLSSLPIASISALAWGCAHATFGALWFLGTVLAFFVYSCAYIAWRKVSSRSAFAAAAVPHALINFGVFVVSAAVA